MLTGVQRLGCRRPAQEQRLVEQGALSGRRAPHNPKGTLSLSDNVLSRG
jgi:hypothetical protein